MHGRCPGAERMPGRCPHAEHMLTRQIICFSCGFTHSACSAGAPCRAGALVQSTHVNCAPCKDVRCMPRAHQLARDATTYNDLIFSNTIHMFLHPLITIDSQDWHSRQNRSGNDPRGDWLVSITAAASIQGCENSNLWSWQWSIMRIGANLHASTASATAWVNRVDSLGFTGLLCQPQKEV